VRAPLRVVFAYRQDSVEGSALVGRLTEAVIGGLPIEERLQVAGDTCLVVGNRGEVETFPYGYFKTWVLDTNTGRFRRV